MSVKKLDRVLSLSPNYRVETKAQPGGLFVAALMIDGFERTAAQGVTSTDALESLRARVETWQMM